LSYSGAITVTGNTGCRDGYVDAATGLCTSVCPIGSFGVATYNFRGTVETSICQTCPGTCYECVSVKGSTECKSCAKGHYLDTGSNTKTTGACILKSGSIADTFLYVAPVASQNVNPSSSITGILSTDPFNSIQDAMAKAYEIGAPYTYAFVTILLMDGNHAMIREASDYYMPTAYDKYSQTTLIEIKSASEFQLTVLYKLRDKWNFPVGAGLKIKSVIFDATDSVIRPSIDK
jgi:hypothetical protein